MPLRRPRAVLLDLDGTLLDYGDDAWRVTVRTTCTGLADAAPGLDAGRCAAAYERICLAHWRTAATTVIRSSAGSVDGHAIWREHWRQALTACGHRDDGLAEHAFTLYRTDRLRRYRLYPDVAAALAAVRRAVDAVAVVTNGPGDTQREKLDATGLDGCFDAVLVSGEVGVAKPDRRIFEEAATVLGVAPGDAWHVGDSLASDVAGAHNAGLGAGIWLNRAGAPAVPEGPAPAVQIRALTELVELLPAQRGGDGRAT